MSIETAVYQYLVGFESITDEVGTNIWKYHLPQTFDWGGPAVSLWRVSETHDHSLDGGSGVARARIQVDTWSLDPEDAEHVAEEIRLVLQGYRGPLTEDVYAMSILLDNIAVLPEPPEAGTDVWRHHIASDYMVIYREPKPQF